MTSDRVIDLEAACNARTVVAVGDVMKAFVYGLGIGPPCSFEIRDASVVLSAKATPNKSGTWVDVWLKPSGE
jgi:hypothetical protein